MCQRALCTRAITFSHSETGDGTASPPWKSKLAELRCRGRAILSTHHRYTDSSKAGKHWR